MTTMHDPSHPGEILREEILGESGLGVSEAAALLGVSRMTVSRVLNGRSGVSCDLAMRLEIAGIGTARAWMAMQMQYDLYHAERSRKPKGVRRFPQAA